LEAPRHHIVNEPRHRFIGRRRRADVSTFRRFDVSTFRRFECYIARMPDLVLIDLDRSKGIAKLTLNRPEARNPTSIAMLDAMDRGLDVLSADDGARVLILSGSGKTFCAGLDLYEVRSDEHTIHRMLMRLSQVMRRIRRLPVPTIARVQGAAIGGGFGFLAVCDFAVTHPEARIGYPPVETGLSPALMAPWLMRLIGPSRARAMVVQGGTITGAEAHERGIVSHLAEPDALDDTVNDLSAELRKAGPTAMRAMKNLLNELDDSMNDAMLDAAARVSAEVIASKETQDRLKKFRDRP
jgi:methylglutaconyl-CoA hydratase